MKKTLATAVSLLLVTATGYSSAEAGTNRPTTKPTTYIVSNEPGVFPEGISVSPDGTMYVTSFGTGAVYRGNTSRPTMDLFLPAGTDGRTQAAGVHTDERGRLFIAGFSTGALFVYDPDGALVAKRVAPVTGAALNDLVITDDAVYVTDSATGILWRAPISGSRIGELTAWLESSDFPVRPGFLNGIVTADDQRVALVADQGTGAGVPGDGHLFKVDLVHRTATEVRESGGLIGASDGLLREGNRLYGVVNVPAGNGGWTYTVNLAILDPALTVATVVAQSDARTEGQTPTTIARDGRRLLWVISQLGNPDPAPPFTVEEVPGLR